MQDNTKPIPQMEPWFDEKETEAVSRYMQGGGWVMEFKETETLEHMIAEYVGAKHCIMTTNGTISLTLALFALGLRSGDEVLVPDMTMIASPNAVKLAGGVPVLVDIEKETLCIDLEAAKKAVTPRTKVLMYVSFNGRSGDMERVRAFCTEHGIYFLEDAAQALGSFYNQKHLGTFGDIGSFSFSVPKIITMGQGGALVTDSDEYAIALRRLKDFGRDGGGGDIHNHWGWNFKFTDIQAVIGQEQMKKLPWRVERKKEIYRKYQEYLKNVSQVEWISTNLENTSPWFIEVLVDDPGGLHNYLKQHSIGSRPLYPAIHSQKIYQEEYRGVSFPVTEDVASRGLWLPSSSKLLDGDIKRIAETIKTYYK